MKAQQNFTLYMPSSLKLLKNSFCNNILKYMYIVLKGETCT